MYECKLDLRLQYKHKVAKLSTVCQGGCTAPPAAVDLCTNPGVLPSGRTGVCAPFKGHVLGWTGLALKNLSLPPPPSLFGRTSTLGGGQRAGVLPRSSPHYTGACSADDAPESGQYDCTNVSRYSYCCCSLPWDHFTQMGAGQIQFP